LDNQSCDLGPDCQQRHDVSPFDSRGCAVTVTWTITIGFKDNGTYTYRVSLKDLDPDTVKWTKDRPFENAVHVDTTNSVKAIAEAFSPPAGKAEEGDKQTWVELVFDNKADAERFVKAFKHAIRLCGGKPSAF